MLIQSFRAQGLCFDLLAVRRMSNLVDLKGLTKHYRKSMAIEKADLNWAWRPPNFAMSE
jgi:hypothetical protein